MSNSASSNGITIRQAVLADLEQLAHLFDQYRQFYGNTSDVQGALAFLTERFNHGESVLFIAHDGADALGFTQMYPSFSSGSMARIFVFNDLFVNEAARRRGVARSLIEASADFARQCGAKRLTLSTARTNSSAQALYRSMGWELDEVYLDFQLGLR